MARDQNAVLKRQREIEQISRSRSGLSARQRSAQHRASRLPFKGAVRSATDSMFGFTHRSTRGKALWSETERVWLGSSTFLHWAMRDAEIDIPRMVAKTDDAPDSTDELLEAVYAELKAYWADHLASLPSKSTPAWLPLP